MQERSPEAWGWCVTKESGLKSSAIGALSDLPSSLLEAVLESGPMALVMVDAGGRIVLVNRETERMFGYARDELLGASIDMLVPETFRQGHPALRAGFLQAPTDRPMGAGRELNAQRRDGSQFPVEIALKPIRHGDVLYVLGVVVDISGRRRLERRFEQAVQAAPNAMLMADASGRIVLANREAERLFGYGADELIGMAVDALVPSRFAAAHPRMRDGYVGHPEARRMGEGRDLFGRRRDGSELPIEIGLNPIATDDGLFVLAAIVDISERLESQRALRLRAEELERANRALEQSNMELQQFAYVASHDLQTPLRAISGFVELLERRAGAALDESSRDLIRRAADGANRMNALIRDLLEYARVDSRARPFGPIDLGTVVADALVLLDASIADSGATVEYAALPTVVGDRAQLVQLMQNLIGNAVKYHGDRAPRIVVNARPFAEGWEISVEDNGIGIAPEHREKVFEVFRRLHATKDYPGTGIGLAICRRVVHRHNGEIRISDAPGGGAVFTFTLNAVAEA
jgi:PAS domain S-box-containing protein